MSAARWWSRRVMFALACAFWNGLLVVGEPQTLGRIVAARPVPTASWTCAWPLVDELRKAR